MRIGLFWRKLVNNWYFKSMYPVLLNKLFTKFNQTSITSCNIMHCIVLNQLNEGVCVRNANEQPIDLVSKKDKAEQRRTIVPCWEAEPKDLPVGISLRVWYDFKSACCNVLNFFSVECEPLSAYRLGKPSVDIHRLFRNVLPLSVFQKQTSRNVYRLRLFPEYTVVLTWSDAI